MNIVDVNVWTAAVGHIIMDKPDVIVDFSALLDVDSVVRPDGRHSSRDGVDRYPDGGTKLRRCQGPGLEEKLKFEPDPADPVQNGSGGSGSDPADPASNGSGGSGSGIKKPRT